MFKLHISENEELFDEVFHIGLFKFEDTLYDMQEDMVEPDDVVVSGDNYSNQYDTRKFLKKYLDYVAQNIKGYPCVKLCYVRPASKKTKTGLSNYIDIVFKHPKDVTKDEENSHYKYSIRFSDHDPSDDEDLIGCVKIVGMKPKNFEKAANRILKTKRSVIQKQISDFENERFGKTLTTITF